MASLNAVLATAVRPRVPLAALKQIPDSDRIVVENILNVAGSISPFLDLSQTSVQVVNNTYKTTVAFCDSPSVSVDFQDMQKLMTYNPGRIDTVRVFVDSEKRMKLCIFITNEKTPFDVSEYDVIRIQKRRRI